MIIILLFIDLLICVRLAQLGERRYAERSALSERSRIQTPAGPTLRFCLYHDICKRLDFLVFSDKHENEKP